MLNLFQKNKLRNLLILLAVFHCKIFSQPEKELSIKLNNNDKLAWWAKHNNNGIDLKKSYLSFKINNAYNNFRLSFNSFLSNEELILGESFFSYTSSDNKVIKIGKYYRDFSTYLNDEISSGSLLISKNALPIPKIGFKGEYQLKKRPMNFNYGISHAFLDKNEVYNIAPYIHEKFIYLNFKANDIKISLGLVHEAIWGGSSKLAGKFPNSFDDFLKVFISADGDKIDGQPHANALGNHLGIWDFYITKKYSSSILKIYYQHLFEDTSGLRFANRFDGLWGIEIFDEARNINYLLEYLDTSNQNRDPPYVNEAYYNHSEYTQGWFYKNNIIGNSFINNFDPNPLKLLHFGLKADINKYGYKILSSRRIDIDDKIKYSISISKKFQDLSITLIFNKDITTNAGLTISYKL